MRSFFGGSSTNDTAEKKPTTSSSMFSYFTNGPDLGAQSQQPQNAQQPKPQGHPQPGQQTPQRPQQNSQQPVKPQGSSSSNVPSQSSQQGSSNPGQPPSDPASTPLKIKLSSPTLAIGTPILCHGYNNQEGVFCWYRISPSNPFYLITTTLQPSYTPTIDDANNTIICQFKPDAGVPSEYARLGPIRLPPETAHSVIRLMQNKQFINTPLTYLNSKGFQNITLMKKWLQLMTTIQELEVQKAEEIKKNQEIGQQKPIPVSPTKKQPNPDQSTTAHPSDDEDEIVAFNKNKYDPQIDYKLALAHQELHSLIIADSFNPLVRAAPVQNAMENHNLRHLQDYTLTINSDTLELVFTLPDTGDDHTFPPDGSDEDSEDEEHATVSKNRSSMGDLLSFLSAGVGSDDPNAKPIAVSALNKIGESSDDEDDEDEDESEEETAPKTPLKSDSKAKVSELTVKTPEHGVKSAVTALASPKKTLSKQNQALMWNSQLMPSIPLSSAVIFTTRHDIVIPAEHNKPQQTTPLEPTESVPESNSDLTPSQPSSTTAQNTSSSSSTSTPTKSDLAATYPSNKLLLIMDVRTSFIYAFYFESDITRDHYGLALRAMSEKLHSKRAIPTIPGLTAINNVTPSPISSSNIGANTSAALTSIIPPAPVFKSWLPIDLQRKYKISPPTSLPKIVSPTIPPTSDPGSPILAQLSSTVSSQANYFNDLEPIELFETIARSDWFQELHPGYIPPLPPAQNPSNQSSMNGDLKLGRELSQHSTLGSTPPGSTHSSTAPSQATTTNNTNNTNMQPLPQALNNQDNVLPDVALLFKVYQYDQDTLVSLLQEKFQYLYQRNLTHKRQAQLLTKQQHMVSLELEIYKEKYYNERAYNDELVQSYYDTMSQTPSAGNRDPIISRQHFHKQSLQLLVKNQSMLADTRGYDLTGGNADIVTPVKGSGQGQDKLGSTLTNHHKDSTLNKDLLTASMSTPQLTRVELSNDVEKLQDQVMQYQQVIQQLKRDNKQLIASNLAYKEQASMSGEYEEEIHQLKQKLSQKTTAAVNSSSSSSSSSSSPAIATLQSTIVELSQQTQTQQQDIALKDRKLANFETQISKLTQQLHLAYQQQQDLITKGIKVEQEKLRQQYNSTEQELSNATNVMNLMQNENNLYKTQASLMESLNIQQHVEIETLETTIDTLQTSLVGLINENEYLKKQQQAFITLQQQFKQQQAQVLLLQHENVTLSNTIQEHQQHIVNLQQQKQMLTRNQSLVGAPNGGTSMGGGLSIQSGDQEKVTNLHSELQYYKQKCFSLSTSLERLMRKHHQEMMHSNSASKLGNSGGKKGSNANVPPRNPVSGANNALIDPLNDNTDQELLQKIYTQQAHTMTHEQLCKEYKNMIKQLELLLETNKLLRFDMKQLKLQHDAIQQQLNDKRNGTNQNAHSQITMQTLQRDLLEKQLNETKHLVTTLTFVLQDKQQHIELIKSTNKQLVIELDYIKKQLHDLHVQQQENQHLAALQQVANGQNPNGDTSAQLQQPFYF